VASLYSAVQRMRLTSSNAVSSAAERVMHVVLEAYAEPDRNFDDLRLSIRDDHHRDRLRDFSEACRNV